MNDEQTNNRRHVERDVTTEGKKKKLSNGHTGGGGIGVFISRRAEANRKTQRTKAKACRRDDRNFYPR